MPHRALISTVRSQLETERARLRERIDSLRGGEGALVYDENFADSGQVAAEQGENLALLAQLDDQLAEIERALGKVAAGTYGICESCERPIAEQRLEAMPAARFCIDDA